MNIVGSMSLGTVVHCTVQCVWTGIVCILFCNFVIQC